MPMPEFIRAAIEAQGKVSADEVERQAALVDLAALEADEQRRLREANEQRRLGEPEAEPPWWTR